MENRKKLHDYGLVLIFLGVLNLFTFVSTIVAGLVEGTVFAAFANEAPEVFVVAMVIFGVVSTLLALIVFADVFIGIKALNVSKTPTAARGHIIAANIFFVMSVLAAISAVVTLFDGSAPIIDTILNLANAVLGAAVYVLFIKAAQAVRRDVLDQTK